MTPSSAPNWKCLSPKSGGSLNTNSESIIGSVDPATIRETDEGLYVEGRLDIENSKVAKEAWRSVKADTIGLSFGYLAQRRECGDGVTELVQVDLFEVSLTPKPSNRDTRFLSLKSVDDDRPTQAELRERCAALGIDVDGKSRSPRVRIVSFDL